MLRVCVCCCACSCACDTTLPHWTVQATADARNQIGRLQSLLRQPVDNEQRFQLAEQFKPLFENLVVLMQLSERQQSKGFVRNINITLDSLEQVCTTSKRTAYLHNQNLKVRQRVRRRVRRLTACLCGGRRRCK